MKYTKQKIVMMILIVLVIPSVLSIYGGESSLIFSFDKCKDLTVLVNGTLQIDNSEYLLNCGTNVNNTWSCDCYDGFDLILNTTQTTLNNYTFKINYGYDEITEEITTGGSGRRRSRRVEFIIPEPEINKTPELINISTTINESFITNTTSSIKELNTTNTTDIPPIIESDDDNNIWWLIGITILFVIMILVIIYLVCFIIYERNSQKKLTGGNKNGRNSQIFQ